MRFPVAPRRACPALLLFLALGAPAVHGRVPAAQAAVGAVRAASSLSGPAGMEEPERYARVTSSKARIRNLADEKGVAIASPEVGDLLAVFMEIPEGWLLVEVPGGYSVWVFGRFLAETEEQDVYEVTRNAVQIRPGPSQDVTNFPLPQRLHAGDRVRMIERLDAERPLAETWAHIWSPAGVRAWIKTNATEPLPAGSDGAALWSRALTALPGTRPVDALARPGLEAAIQPAAAAKSERTMGTLGRELEAARSMLSRESKKDAPDIAGTRRLFQALLGKSPDAGIAAEAKDGLAQLDVLEEVAALKVEIQKERARRKSEILGRQRDVWEASRKKDPLGEVFAARGVLFRRRNRDEAARYYLRFGSKTVAELHCASGRYDIELFAGYEVGVQGEAAMEGVADPSELGGREGDRIPRIDVSRLEIIQRR